VLDCSGGSTGGRGGRSPPPLDCGQKNKFIARPKITHICKHPFVFQNVLKLTYSNLEFQNFPGEDHRTPYSMGGQRRGREGRRGRGKGREGGREARNGGWGGDGKGGEGAQNAPSPLETSSGSAPARLPESVNRTRVCDCAESWIESERMPGVNSISDSSS